MSLLLAAGLSCAQTMDRSAGSMRMRPDGPGEMWGAAEREGGAGSPGERLYRFGRLPGDRTVQAERGGNPVGPDQVACANCHGRSGYGGREGGIVVPALRQDFLDARRAGDPGARAEGVATLARIVRAGLAPDGRILSPLMPRYQLSDTEVSALFDTLAALQDHRGRGSDAAGIHVATVISGAVPPARREAMLATLRDYAAEVGQRAGAPPWLLEVWTLDGSPAERREQLEQAFRAQPVAAVLGGLGDDSWLGVHRFCEQHAVPCLFPQTALPPVDPGAYYSVYFDKGWALSAEVLGRYLQDRPDLLAAGPLVQILPARWDGYVPASALRAYLGRAAARRVRDVTLRPGQHPDREYWRILLASEHPGALMLWGEEVALAPLAQALDGRSVPVIIAAEAMPGAQASDPNASSGLDLHILARWQREATGPVDPEWTAFQARHPADDGELQTRADTWFAARVFDDALGAQGGDAVVADRLIERVEYAAGAQVRHPLRPDLALGMGQRFAGKHGWLMPWKAEALARAPITP